MIEMASGTSSSDSAQAINETDLETRSAPFQGTYISDRSHENDAHPVKAVIETVEQASPVEDAQAPACKPCVNLRKAPAPLSEVERFAKQWGFEVSVRYKPLQNFDPHLYLRPKKTYLSPSKTVVHPVDKYQHTRQAILEKGHDEGGQLYIQLGINIASGGVEWTLQAKQSFKATCRGRRNHKNKRNRKGGR